MLILRIAFLYYFGRELYLTSFKQKNNKYAWFIIVLCFGIYGYSFYLAYRRRLVKKRLFSPKFNTKKT